MDAYDAVMVGRARDRATVLVRHADGHTTQARLTFWQPERAGRCRVARVQFLSGTAATVPQAAVILPEVAT